MQRQEGRVAIVTGGVRDVGVAIARQLIAEGATAVVADVHDDDGAKLVAELGDRARYVHLDVASEEQWSTLPEAILAEFGRIDVLVNAADYNEFTPMIPLTKMDPKMAGDRPVVTTASMEQYQRIVGVNQTGVFLGMRAVLPVMAEARRGSVVNVGSIDLARGAPGYAVYCAADHAMVGLTKAAALEAAPYGVRVNAVSASRTTTRAGTLAPDFASHMNVNIPIGRLAEASEVAKAVAFLASDDASYAVGSIIIADGGRLAGPAVAATTGLLPPTP